MAKGHCSGYSKGGAPTVCVEGTNNGNGTHGKMHDEMIKDIKAYKKSGWFSDKDKIDYEDAKEIALDGFERTFPESRCSRACLRKQLDNYYKNCDDDMPAVAGKAFTEDEVDSQNTETPTGNKR
ncbi:HNH/endonuclease VII fold toxin-2 domain-containing protein [Escherichia coli]